MFVKQGEPSKCTNPVLSSGKRWLKAAGDEGTLPAAAPARHPKVKPSPGRLRPENGKSGKILDLLPGYDINKKTFPG